LEQERRLKADRRIRAVVDGSWVDDPAESGNMLSPWERNLVDRRQTLDSIEIAGTRAEAVRNRHGTLTLPPPH
jgi:hypothetical protein